MKRVIYWFLTLLCACFSLAAAYHVVYEINLVRGFFLSIFALGILLVMEVLDEL